MTDSLQQSGGWAALARLTGLFEWTAVGSILLFFTLVVTIGIASASTRNLLKQERAVLSHIRRMMQSVSALQLMAKMLFEKQLELKDFAEYDSWSHLYVEFDNIDLLTLPTENSMQAVSDGRSYLKWLSDIYSCGKRTAEMSIEYMCLVSAQKRTEYWIGILEREIEDRNPNWLSRAVRQVRRGAARTMPSTVLSSAISDAGKAKQDVESP